MARARKPPPPPGVQRKIHFYQVDAGDDDKARSISFDLAAALDAVEALPFTAAGRYATDVEGNALCIWFEERKRRSLRLGSIRRTDLPQTEAGGTIRPMRLQPNEGLLNQTHLVLFSDNVVGADFNFYGPRVSRLGAYLAEKAPGVCPPLTFTPLVSSDTQAKLARKEDIRLLDLKIRRGWIQAVTEASPDLGAALDQLGRVSGAQELEIVLQPTLYSRTERLDIGLLAVVRRLLGRPVEDIRHNVSRFAIKGRDSQTGSVDVVDLLSDRLIATKRILTPDPTSRALVAAQAYAAIEEAHTELQVEISQALPRPATRA